MQDSFSTRKNRLTTAAQPKAKPAFTGFANLSSECSLRRRLVPNARVQPRLCWSGEAAEAETSAAACCSARSCRIMLKCSSIEGGSKLCSPVTASSRGERAAASRRTPTRAGDCGKSPLWSAGACYRSQRLGHIALLFPLGARRIIASPLFRQDPAIIPAILRDRSASRSISRSAVVKFPFKLSDPPPRQYVDTGPSIV